MVAGISKGEALREPTFVLDQLPGCGGRVLGEFLYLNFAVLHDEPDAEVFGRGGDGPVLTVDTGRLSGVHAFTYRSHSRYGAVFIEKLYPEFFASNRFFTAIFLDDPLASHAASYLQMVNRGEKLPDFGRFLKEKRNPLCCYLGIRTETDIERVLSRYDFVGMAGAQLASSVQRLAGALKKKMEAAGGVNPARTAYYLENWLAKEHPCEADPEFERLIGTVGPVARMLFKLRNPLDYQLFRAAKARR